MSCLVITRDSFHPTSMCTWNKAGEYKETSSGSTATTTKRSIFDVSERFYFEELQHLHTSSNVLNKMKPRVTAN